MLIVTASLCRGSPRFWQKTARLFGLSPQKGALEKGADADIVVFDPALRHILKGENQHTKAGYTLFEGRECLGKPVLTLQRGRVILDREKLIARPGDGRYIPLAKSKK